MNSPQICRELIWRMLPEWQSSEPLPFELPADLLRECWIRWPAVLAWSAADSFVQHIRNGLAELVPLVMAPLDQPYGGIVMFEFIFRGESFPIALDYHDSPEQIDRAAASRAALYFKMQYRREGYAALPFRELAAIIPGGYVMPSKHAYAFLGAARRRSDRTDRRFDVYGRFGLDFAEDIRRRAIMILQQQTSFDFCGGDSRVRYSQHLMDAASSKVCIDLPGNGPFCFRLVDYLATGCCVVALRHRTRFPVPLEPGVHIAYVRDDLSDLVETCRYYIENEAARLAMLRESRKYFDRYLAKRQLASYYLSCCVNAASRFLQDGRITSVQPDEYVAPRVFRAGG